MYIFAPVPGIAITVAKVPARIAANTVLAIKHMDQPGGLYDYWSGSPSPGGGGPGQSLTSTNSPTTVKEAGRIITHVSSSGRLSMIGVCDKRFTNKWGAKRRCIRPVGHKGKHHAFYPQG